jgi:hypothetical protein
MRVEQVFEPSRELLIEQDKIRADARGHAQAPVQAVGDIDDVPVSAQARRDIFGE